MNDAEIRRALATLGYGDPISIREADGRLIYNAVVERFQRAFHLNPDGKAGRVTAEALRKALAARDLTGKRPTKTKARPVHTLVWHCTATAQGKEHTREDIRAMHLARGFSDIGYHKLVHLDGSVSEGRSERTVGAHVAGHNTGTLGYSYVGGVLKDGRTARDTRTTAQKTTMERLTREAIERYGIRSVVGHRDFSPDKDGDGLVEPSEWIKVCPCFDAAAEYAPLLAKKAA